MKTISVIVPVYNNENTLERCVNSILAQDYGDIEVILVDDGSNPQCAALCQKIAASNPRIKLFTRQNGGAGAARNTGLSHAGGAYIGFVDADDTIESQMYTYLYGLLQQYNCAVAACNITYVYPSKTRVSGAGLPQTLLPSEEAEAAAWQHDYVMMSVCNKLFVKSAVEGRAFPSSKLSEDGAFLHEVFKADIKMAWGPEALYNYNMQDSQSATRAGYTEESLKSIDLFDDILKSAAASGKNKLYKTVYQARLWQLYILITHAVRSACGTDISALKALARRNAFAFLGSTASHKAKLFYMLFLINTPIAAKVFKRLRKEY